MAKLILEPTSPSARREVPLLRSPMSIGRDPSNDIVVADPMASRYHAVVERRGGRYYVRDCNSLNGFTVNGARLSERGLRSGDLVGIGSTRLVYWEGPSGAPPPLRRAVCAACGTAGSLPARFCSACGSALPPPDPPFGTAPIPESPAPEPEPPHSGTRVKNRPEPRLLSPQQVSLLRAVVLGGDDYLHRSYFVHPETGQKVAHSLQASEWSRFAAAWSVEPVACIRAINRAITRLRTPARIRRYLEAAVDLETFMDRGILEGPARVLTGIPAYLMDGYTDMGQNPSRNERHGREKIKVDKERLRPWLVETRWRALAHARSLEEVLAELYAVVRRSLSFDEGRVKDLSLEWMDRSVDLSRFLEDGVGLCRHHSILYQLCLQEAAIAGRVVKGSLQVYGLRGRHAWNLAWFGGRVALVDVTLPARDGPLIVVGDSLDEVYRLANREERRYVPTPDRQNHYKVGPPAEA